MIASFPTTEHPLLPPERAEMEVVEVIHRTKKAVLIEHEGERFWVPLSLIENPGVYQAGYVYDSFRVSEWFALQTAMI